ncbi:MAG: hypothetical protein Q7V62_14355, partial [Actinomycetota bacterium]|nr:hypothetical protein [Actinomycetota bacterium]
KLKGLGEDAGDAFESFGSSLGSLRRLLEHHPEQTRLGTRAVARRLLASYTLPQCEKPSCDQTQICIADVVRDVIKLVTSLAEEGLRLGIQAVFAFLRLILGDVLDEIERLLRALLDIDALPDIADPFASVELNLGMRWPRVFAFALPAAPSLPSLAVSWTTVVLVLVVLAAGLFLAYRIGVLVPLLDAATQSLKLAVVAGAASLLVALTVVLYQLRSELRAQGYELEWEWQASAQVYAMCGALLVIALMQAIVEDGFALGKEALHAARTSKPKPERRPLVKT